MFWRNRTGCIPPKIKCSQATRATPPETAKTTSGDIEIDRCVSGAERVRCISKDVTTIPGDDEGVGCVSVSSFVPGRVSTIPSFVEGVCWLSVEAASILIIASCVNEVNSSTSQTPSSSWVSVKTARISWSKFRIVSSFSCNRSFCSLNNVFFRGDSRLSSLNACKISSADEIIFLVTRSELPFYRKLSRHQDYRS